MRTNLNECIFSSGTGQREYQPANINAEPRIITCDIEATGK